MGYSILAMTKLNGIKRTLQSINSPDTQSIYDDICEEISLSGWGWDMPNITMSKKPTQPLSLVNRQVVEHRDEYLFVWLVSFEHMPLLKKAVDEWISHNEKPAPFSDIPQTSYSNVLAGFYIALAQHQAKIIAELKDQLDKGADDLGQSSAWDEGYADGVNDGILTVSREMDCSVVSDKVWRNNKGRKDAGLWQCLYAEQLAVARANAQRVNELHSLIESLIETRPINDGIRKELIVRLHSLTKRVAWLEKEIGIYEDVDYSVVIKLCAETCLDNWYNVASIVERDNMIATIRTAIANNGKVK